MTKVKLGRRSFLKVSGLTGGGLMFGFNFSACEADKPKMKESVLGLEPNGYIKLFTDGMVTIMSPNPEIGQGVKTSMPMIVAEELDVSWDKVSVEQAPLDTEKYTRQVAGGSNSIRSSWNTLRTAGATVRKILMQTAAKEWKVDIDELTTSNGFVFHKASDRKIGYGDLSTKAEGIEVPEEVELKDVKDFKIIGTDVPNVDSEKIVHGEPLFGLDYKEEGMKLAMIIHPPAFGMKIKAFDATDIKARPGIDDVFTINSVSESGETISMGNNTYTELIAIVGNSTWTIMKAKKDLKVEWEWETEPESSEGHRKKLNDLLDSKSADKRKRVDGNPEAAFKKAAKVVERTYTAPFLAHNTMEPMNFFAHVTADKAVLTGPIQTPEWMRSTLVELLGMEESQIQVNMTRMGGGFGRRLYGNFGLEAALISKQIAAPVKLIYTREDDMTQGTYRPDYAVRYKAGLDENNNIIALTVKGTGTDGGPVFHNRYPAGAIKNYSAENASLDSNISTGAWRAPRSNFISFAEQSFIDELAEMTGKDPIEFRLDLFKKAMEQPVGEDNDYDASRYAGVLKLVKEKSGWNKSKPDTYRGVSAYFCHNTYVAQVVDVKMKGNTPIIEKVWCAIDCGIVVNRLGALNQIEGGIIDGIGHAMYSGLTFTEGKPDQQNFDRYQLIRTNQSPKEIETFFVESDISPTGLGEPTLPPIQAAVANAIYKATGRRLYDQPLAAALRESTKVNVEG